MLLALTPSFLQRVHMQRMRANADGDDDDDADDVDVVDDDVLF